jgi:hypothetical protein
VGGRKPDELPEFHWVNSVLGNLKTGFSGAYRAFGFSRYADGYLAAFAYRFNQRIAMATFHLRLLTAAVHCLPLPVRSLRDAEFFGYQDAR